MAAPKRKTAKELVEGLEHDPVYREQRAAREAETAKRAVEAVQDEARLVRELGTAGVHVDSVYDFVNDVTHEYKEAVKVGYNLRRKIVLLALWAASPLLLFIDPTMLRTAEPHTTIGEFVRHLGYLWLALGVGGLLFRTVQLFKIRDVQTGLVWATKILTDPFHDIKLYYRAPGYLLRGELIEAAAPTAHPG